MIARRISGYLEENTSSLGRLTAEARRLERLSRIWEAIAPSGLARSSGVARLDSRVLTLYALNGAVAAKLKQQLPRLLVAFRGRGCDLTSIEVDVQVTRRQVATPSRQKKRISPKGLACIEKLEHDLEPSPLKQALTNLLQHQRSSADEEAP